LNNNLTRSNQGRLLSGIHSWRTCPSAGYRHFSSSALNSLSTSSSNVEKTITLKEAVKKIHDSLAHLLGIMDTALREVTIKNLNIRTIQSDSGETLFFRSFVGQLFCLVLLEWVLETHPDLLIHEKSEIMTALSNTMRFFLNNVFQEGDKQVQPSALVAYLINLISSLQKGKISKDLKSKELKVPNAGTLKISGHKFMCLKSMKEIQKVKNQSNFALIMNYSTAIFLVLVLEN